VFARIFYESMGARVVIRPLLVGVASSAASSMLKTIGSGASLNTQRQESSPTAIKARMSLICPATKVEDRSDRPGPFVILEAGGNGARRAVVG